jgi:hypothetical protein
MKKLFDLFQAYAKAFQLPEWITNDIAFGILLTGFIITIFIQIRKIIKLLRQLCS